MEASKVGRCDAQHRDAMPNIACTDLQLHTHTDIGRSKSIPIPMCGLVDATAIVAYTHLLLDGMKHFDEAHFMMA